MIDKEKPETNQASATYDVTNEIDKTEWLGEHTDQLEAVPGHQLHDPEWLETIDEDKLNIIGPMSARTYDTAETVCGRDDRVKITPTTAAPFKFICKLFITAADGGNYIGSGFFIGPRCIITSGHVVNDRSGWAKKIQVVPGMNGNTAPFGSQTSELFYSVVGWTRDKDSDYDHGAIILPDNTLYNRVRGFFGFKQENGLPLLNNSGYPGDKRPTTEQWYNAGRATKNDGAKFEYMLDTYGGQSGSPTWVGSASSGTVVGVHGYGGCPNKCIRSQGYVLQRWNEWRQK